MKHLLIVCLSLFLINSCNLNKNDGGAASWPFYPSYLQSQKELINKRVNFIHGFFPDNSRIYSFLKLNSLWYRNEHY